MTGRRWNKPSYVLLLNPYQLPLVVALLVLSITFTWWPEALEHAPISFEQRGIIHHVWHYGLMAGAGLTLAGMMLATRRRLTYELVGLCLLAGAVAMNLTAIVVSVDFSEVQGLALALRFGILAGFIVRIVTIVTEPIITVSDPMRDSTGERR